MADRPRAHRKIDALNDLASAFLRDGKLADAMDACIRSLQSKETPEARALFVRLIRTGTTYANEAVRHYLIRALCDPWCRTGQLVPAAFALIRSTPVVGESIERGIASWPTPLSIADLFGSDGIPALAADALFNAVLENTPALGLEFEHFLTVARHALLIDAVTSLPREETDPSTLRLQCAVARQCYINEYVYAETAQERESVARLRDAMTQRLTEMKHVPGAWIAALASYSPLFLLPDCGRLSNATVAPPLAELFVQQVNEPMQEKNEGASLPRLTPIENAISKLVSDQYEQNPYPRWVRSPSIEAVRFGAFVASELGLDPHRFARRDDRVDVLIAGCGTGQQSIQTARKFPQAKILAVDLSTSSLAYAKRKTRELRITNIQYAQADILGLDAVGRTYDLIECIGVLHHLDDPVAGWRVLASLLRPEGIMRIGLYSALARRDIAAAQELAAAQGYTGTTESIRQFRVDLQLQDRWRPFRFLTAMEDFYDTSGCRDLLFHAREHRFTLPRIKQILAELELDFLKFNVDGDVQRRYSQRYRGELALADLNGWTQFEVEHPGTFLGMYNFYVQKRT